MKFNIDEVFQLAEQIERNGAKFYSQAANTVSSDQLKHLLEELAAMELQHEQVFKMLHADIKFHQASAIFDLDESAAAYLQALASDYVFPADLDPTSFLKPETTPHELIAFAIRLEKDSIVFYYGLKNLLTNPANVHQVEAIIKQEFGHINQLNQMACQFGKS